MGSVTSLLQYSAPAVSTVGGQARWSCRPGWKPQAGWRCLRRLLLLAFCLLVVISPVLCLLNILPFILSLNGGNLFMNRWLHCKTSMIAELLKRDDCVVLFWTSMKNRLDKLVTPKLSSLGLSILFSYSSSICVVYGFHVPLHTWLRGYRGRCVDTDCKNYAWV